jgi:signal transduction histidine kinase
MTMFYAESIPLPREARRDWLIARRPTGLRRVAANFLRAPLVLKLIGANVVIALATVWTAMATHGMTLADREVAPLILAALVVAQIVNSALVIVALKPLRSLEDVSSTILSGDSSARVPDSPLADRTVARTSRALNTLLDDLMQERGRIRRLASKVIRAQDEERARVATELHDRTAQTIAGLVLQLSVARRSCTDSAMATQLQELYTVASEALEEVRTISHTIYPRVLVDLGLPAALDRLARRTRETSNVDVDVIVRGGRAIPPTAASALYRVSQEALVNAIRHASASNVEIRLDTDDWYATLEVEDNGIGFDPRAAEAERPGMGIFSMRERVGLIDGVFDIESAPGRGSCVRASVPLYDRGADVH